MPRPEYYNLRRTDDRQARIEAIAAKLGLDFEKSATWGVIVDFALGITYWLVIKCHLDYSQWIKGDKNNES